MYKQGIPGFKYFVGVDSLAKVATRDDRVCVLNILGGEFSDVTPVSHAFSGGNVAFGTSPGRGGQKLRTPIGDVPVFNSVREGLNAGQRFNTGVVYLPPTAVRDGVAELVRVNPDLEKIIIVTEKVSVHDAREIRAMGQTYGIDIFGANGLGVADAWNKVRIGGALGGDNPGETLLKGSVAIFSNSGNFTTTIANYLATAGWGTTTSISSGKDVYIHFAAPEFIHALGNDERSRAAVMYAEPGGYYELGLESKKPIVACVVGRWKAKLTRAVGHAGAMAGFGDDAASKEGWFMEMFGVDGVFSPRDPICSAKGAVVTNIAHIPQALTKVMALNGIEPDFAPKGDLSLKAWLGNNQGLVLPAELDLPVVEAPDTLRRPDPRDPAPGGCRLRSPIDEGHVGRHPHGPGLAGHQPAWRLHAGRRPRPVRIQSVPGHLARAQRPQRQRSGQRRDRGPRQPPRRSDARRRGRGSGGRQRAELGARRCRQHPGPAPGGGRSRRHRDAARPVPGQGPGRRRRDDAARWGRARAVPGWRCRRSQGRRPARRSGRTRRQVGVRALSARPERAGHGGCGARRDRADPGLGASAAQAHQPPHRRQPALAPGALRQPDRGVGAGPPHEHGRFCGGPDDEILRGWSITELAGLALTGRRPGPGELLPYQVLLGLLLSNGPGTISAQGAKGAVSADGPETSERVQLNKAMVGMLTHTGFSHGGNGFEGIQFLLEQFQGQDPDRADLRAMATAFAQTYKREKAQRRELVGEGARAIPGINHPVFRGKPVNTDPREAFVAGLMAERGERNPFHSFYKEVAQALFDQGVTSNVFCVNVDAVIAAWLLHLLWRPYRAGEIGDAELESAAFTIFLLARMAGSAAEIEDHLNRGRNMDTRTTASAVKFIA